MSPLPLRRAVTVLIAAAALAACEPKSASPASPAAAPDGQTDPSQAQAPAPAATPTAAPGTVLITGQLSTDGLPADALGAAPVVLGQRDVEVKDPKGQVVGRAVSSSDGSYAVIAPGALAVETDAPPDALALTSSGLTVQSVLTDTAAVVGIDQPVDLAAAAGGVVALGATPLKKITAIRGVAQLDGARDHTGISVYVPGTSYAARTDSAGRFVLTFIPAGTYQLAFEKDGYLGVTLTDVVVTDGATTDLAKATLRLSGGVSSFSLKQEGGDGVSQTRKVTFRIDPGDADRFKAGLASELEAMPYGAPVGEFEYTFPADGVYELIFRFANADGFESDARRTIVVDTVDPDASQAALADRKTLATAYTNERFLLAWHPTCEDIDSFAVLPASATEPKPTDFGYACYTNVAPNKIGFALPLGTTTFAYKIWARDRVGRISPAPVTGTITLDDLAPPALAFVASDQTSGSTAGSDITTVDVTVTSCADVARVLISESVSLPPEASAITAACATTPKAYQVTFANNIPGPKTLFGWAVDNAGNVSQVAGSAQIAYDPTTPTSSPSFSLADPTPTSAGYSNSATLDANVPSCGDATEVLISESQWSRPTEAAAGWVACSSGMTVTVTAGGDGYRLFHLWGKDVGGNVALAEQTAGISVKTSPTAPPFVSLRDTTSGGNTYTNSSDVYVDLGSCTDIYRIYLSEGTTAPVEASFWQSCSTFGLPFSLASAAEGTKTVRLWTLDYAGNVSAWASSATIELDSTTPGLPTAFTIADTTSGSATHTNSTSVSFTITGCPSGAQVLLSDAASSQPSEFGAWQSCAASGTFSLANSSQGAKTVYLWTKDAAGNVSDSSLSQSITYDSVTPTAGTFTLVDQAGGAVSGRTDSATVAITVADCTDAAYVRFSESSATPAESAFSLACSTAAKAFTWTFSSGTEGTKTLYMHKRDAAGNVSSVASAAIFVDTAAPSVSNFKVTAITPTSVTFSWSASDTGSSAFLQNGVKYGTVSGSLGSDGGPGTTATTVTVSGLTEDTAYYFRVDSSDQVDHLTSTAELAVRTSKVRTVIHTNSATYLGLNRDTSRLAGQRRTLAACDLDGDSKDEVIVAAPDWDDTGDSVTNAGAVYVIFGTNTASGISLPAGANLVYKGSSAETRIGRHVVCLDVNKDGFQDLLIQGGSLTHYVILGSASLPTGTYVLKAANTSYFNLAIPHGSGSGGNVWGTPVVGDYNGDGYADVFRCDWSAGAYCYGYLGAATGSLNATADFTINPTRSPVAPEDTTYYLTDAIVAADVDNDGYTDLLMSSNDADVPTNGSFNSAGAVHVFRGGAAPSGTLASAYQIRSNAANTNMIALAAGDLDNDGYTDILVGGNTWSAYYATYRVIFGQSLADWQASPVMTLNPSSQTPSFSTNFSVSPESAKDSGGIVAIKDFNGDTKPDLIIGDTGASYSGRSSAGMVCVVLSQTRAQWQAFSGLSSNADLCVYGADAGDALGHQVVLADTNGDGRKELVIVSYGGDGPSDSASSNENGEVAIVSFSLPAAYTRPLVVDLAPYF